MKPIEGASANETSPADRDSAGPNRNQTITGAIKGLFRTAVKTLTRRMEDEPVPAGRRRRGEKRGAFGTAAKAVLRRAMRLPPQAFAAATFLCDTLDWLNYWHNDADSSSDPCGTLDANRNDLSPRL